MKNSNRVREFLWGYNFIPLPKRNWNICLFLTCLCSYWRAESCSLGGQRDWCKLAELRLEPGSGKDLASSPYTVLSFVQQNKSEQQQRNAVSLLRCSSRSLLPKSKHPVKVNAIIPISSFIGRKLCKFWWRIEWSCTLHKHVSLKSKTFCFRKKYIQGKYYYTWWARANINFTHGKRFWMTSAFAQRSKVFY